MRIHALAALAVLAAAATTVAPGAAAASGRPTATYPDAIGDSGSAPDLTKLVVADRGGGVLAFRVELGSQQDLADGAGVGVFLDTDRASDGNAEYAAVADEQGVDLERWDGEAWQPADAQAGSPRLRDGVLSFTLALPELSRPGGFGVAVLSLRGNDHDALPEDDIASYPARPQIERVFCPLSVLLPTAGTVMRAKGIQTILADYSPEAPIGMTCRLARQGEALTPLAGGCAWRLPKSLKGRRLTLTVTFSSGGAKLLTHSFPVEVE